MTGTQSATVVYSPQRRIGIRSSCAIRPSDRMSCSQPQKLAQRRADAGVFVGQADADSNPSIIRRKGAADGDAFREQTLRDFGVGTAGVEVDEVGLRGGAAQLVRVQEGVPGVALGGDCFANTLEV